ncbi:pentapeptide repeat-containing protein, partial [Bacillus cereus]|nr:pentapeptide repeat-containing protein [Bacillus cereus]
TFYVNYLRGCKVSTYQAVQFATLLGLIIKD